MIVSAADLVAVLVVPLIVAMTVADTLDVETVKLAVAAPAGTVTLAGTPAAALLEDNFTTMPPAGALPLRFTVALDEAPPATVVGLSVTREMLGTLIVKFAEAVVPEKVAVTVASVLVATGVVGIEKVAEVAPAGTVTDAGTFAADELLDSVTTTPPAGAACGSVTVPFEVPPPTKEFGIITSDLVDTVTLMFVLRRIPLLEPLIVTVRVSETLFVTTLNVAELDPAGTVMLLTTEATDGTLLERPTTAPPDGAADVRVTVPVAELEPGTVVGFTLMLAS